MNDKYRDELEEHHDRQDDAELQRKLDADPRPFGTRQDWNTLTVTCPICGKQRPYKGIAYHLMDDDLVRGDQLLAVLESIRTPYK